MNKDVAVHRISGLNVVVDGFRHATPECKIYFLSHFHGDHYQGLGDEWQGGLIYCSAITTRLVTSIIGVRPEYVKALPMEEEVRITDDMSVSLLDANHCPGACLLLFRLHPSGTLHLHTGDMRYHPRMKDYPLLQGAKIDTVYLDTTYCHPKHDFARQEDAMDSLADSIITVLREEGQGGAKKKALFLLSAYKLGKERILLHVARRTGLKVYVDEDKVRVLSCLGLSPEDMGHFTTDMSQTPIHVCRMQEYLDKHKESGGYGQIIGFIPTGWAESSKYNKRNAVVSRGEVSIRLVAYSEHSNFEELHEFVRFLKPRQVVPTVYADEAHRKQLVSRFHGVVDHTAIKKAFFQKFWSGGGEGSSSSSSGSSTSTKNDGTIEASAPNAPELAVDGKARVLDDGGGEGEGEGLLRQPAPTADTSMGSGEGQSNASASSCVEIEVVDVDVVPVGSQGGGEREGGSGWACRACTYLHTGGESGLLRCSICGTARRGETEGGVVAAKKRGREREGGGSQAQVKTLECFWGKKKQREP